MPECDLHGGGKPRRRSNTFVIMFLKFCFIITILSLYCNRNVIEHGHKDKQNSLSF